MLALEPVIVERLSEALEPAGWAVMGFSSDKGKRDAFPLASVLFFAGNVADSKTGAANLQPAWRITLVTRKADAAAALIDAAVALAIGSLHNWTPGNVAGRRWERMALIQFGPPQYPEDGLVGVDLHFTTAARYDGQD